MEEWFSIAAPRAKRTLEWRGELSDIFFNGSAAELVPLLVVPVELKRQPQKESQKQAALHSAASVASATPIVPTYLQNGNLDIYPSQNAMPTSSRPPTSINTLPFEIYSLIIGHLNDLVDLTCMGLTTPYLWGITQGIIRQRYKAMLGQWAGESIVCVGEDTLPGDYPPDLFSADEVETLNKEVYVWDGPHLERTDPRTLANLTYPPTSTADRGITPVAEAARVYKACLARLPRPGSAALRARLRRNYTDYSDFTPRDQDWILRNLTTKEFVTAEGIALDKDRIDGPFVHGIGFADAILARALWVSSRGTEGLKYGGEIGRGVWAGHRFDITTRTRHDEATKGEEWKDVSEEVKGEIVGIWESEFGPDWKDSGRLGERFAENDDDDEDEG